MLPQILLWPITTFEPSHECLVLITLFSSEVSGESVHLAQTHQRPHCSDTQNMDVDEDFDQNLEL